MIDFPVQFLRLMPRVSTRTGQTRAPRVTNRAVGYPARRTINFAGFRLATGLETRCCAIASLEAEASRAPRRASSLRDPSGICSMLRLALKALNAGEVHRPREGRAAPALPCRTQFGA